VLGVSQDDSVYYGEVLDSEDPNYRIFRVSPQGEIEDVFEGGSFHENIRGEAVGPSGDLVLSGLGLRTTDGPPVSEGMVRIRGTDQAGPGPLRMKSEAVLDGLEGLIVEQLAFDEDGNLMALASTHGSEAPSYGSPRQWLLEYKLAQE
jgi:hypothetical protein